MNQTFRLGIMYIKALPKRPEPDFILVSCAGKGSQRTRTPDDDKSLSAKKVRRPTCDKSLTVPNVKLFPPPSFLLLSPVFFCAFPTDCRGTVEEQRLGIHHCPAGIPLGRGWSSARSGI